MKKHGKKYQEAFKKLDANNLYSPQEAISLVKSMAAAKFDETVEASVRLGVDPRHADQQVRGTVVLPNGTGRTIRVAVFAKGDKVKEAQDAGADVVGGEDLGEEVAKGNINFDVAVATPDMMGVVGKLGRILGPKGLMPNPKAGTVTFDVGKAVKDIKAGKVEYRVDKAANVAVPIGKVSFDEEKLVENFRTLMSAVIKAKPSAAKGTYLRKVTLSSTMGPGVHVNTADLATFIAEK